MTARHSVTAFVVVFVIWFPATAVSGEDTNRIGVVLDRARLLQNRSEFQQALGEFDEALCLQIEQRDLAGQAETLDAVGRIYGFTAEYRYALAADQRAAALWHGLGDRWREALTLLNVGADFGSLGQYTSGVRAYEAARTIARDTATKSVDARALSGLGLISSHLGDLTKAMLLYKQALAVAREAADRQTEADALHRMGDVHARERDYDNAFLSYKRALALVTSLGAKSDESEILAHLGNLRSARHDPHTAIWYLVKALRLAQESRSRESEVYALNSLASVYESLDTVQAAKYYERSLLIVRLSGDKHAQATVLGNLAFLYAKLDRNPRLAIFYGKLAVNIVESIRNDIAALDVTTQLSYLKEEADTYKVLADVLASEGRLMEAEEVLRLLKEKEYRNFTRGGPMDASEAIPLTTREADLDRRYRVIADQAAPAAAEYGMLYSQKHRTEQEERRLLELEKELEASRLLADDFGNQIKKDLGDSAKAGEMSAEIDTSRNLQKTLRQLGAGTVAVEVFIVESQRAGVSDAIRTILVTPDVRLTSQVKVSSNEINREVVLLRQQIASREDASAVERRLYDILVRPIAKDLDILHAQTLMWSLDGALRYIPIQALFDGKQYLIERYRNVLLTLAGREFLKDEPAASWTIAAFGVSKPHENFDPLPYVPVELQGIVRHGNEGVLDGIVRLDEDFTADALRAALLKQYPVVHIASHFSLNPVADETGSYLLLGDGQKMTIAQLRALDFENVDLLTLSACNTAIGIDGEGAEVESFARLAQERGAKAVVATLWSVNDESTEAVMANFYRLRQSGMSKAEALRQAQLQLLHSDTSGPANGAGGAPKASVSRHFSHPFYWAPFVLIGNLK